MKEIAFLENYWTDFHQIWLYFIAAKDVQSVKKKKLNTPINSNTNYRREMKLVLINMDYSLLQFEALKFFLGVCLRRGSQPNFNFFNINSQIF